MTGSIHTAVKHVIDAAFKRLPDDTMQRITDSANETVMIHSIAKRQREACAAWAEKTLFWSVLLLRTVRYLMIVSLMTRKRWMIAYQPMLAVRCFLFSYGSEPTENYTLIKA